MNIGVVAKNDIIMQSAIDLIKNISEKYGCILYFMHENYDGKCKNVIPESEFFDKIEILVSLGGDGTILQYAKKASAKKIPIFGINFGRVGFLTDIEKDEISLFEEVLKGKYIIEERMMIDADVIKDGKKIRKCTALNDVIITRGISPKMIEMQVYIDDVLTDTIRADGIIFSTPTGSTAYSLSAGGSVIDPGSKLIEITPICSHTLKSRPLIIGENRKITVKHINYTENEVSYLSEDGEEIRAFSRECMVNITVSTLKTDLIRVKNRNFYSVLKEKL